jgi:HD superfamily phosphodiesterase
MVDQKTMIEEAEGYIFDLFNEKLSHDYLYHSYQHTLETVEACKKIAKAYPEISEDDMEILLVAAWFHDSGYIDVYKAMKKKAKKLPKLFWSKENVLSIKLKEYLIV